MRKYKRRPQWRDKDKRMTLVVQMRGLGMSLRQIADKLAVSYQTVLRDLRRWEAERPNVIPLSHSGVTTDPGTGQLVTPECDTEPTVLPLRRQA